MKFQNSILGHEEVLRFLENSLIHQKIHHAYLFLGPEHIGKRTVAFFYIQCLLCEKMKKNVEKMEKGQQT